MQKYPATIEGCQRLTNLALLEGFTTGWLQSCVFFFSAQDISNEFPIYTPSNQPPAS
jgi:hypothetical protein